MAITLERLAEGIRRANAAGDVEAVKKLGIAYRQLQGHAAATPGNVADPSAAYSQATANASSMGLKSPEPSILDKLMNATGATVNGISATVPFLQNATDAIGGTVSQITGGSYDDYVNRQKELRAGYAQAAPFARAAGEIGGFVGGGALLGGTRLGAEALGMTGSLGKQALNSTLSSAGVATADALSQGKTGVDALTAGALGGATGLAGFGAGQLVGKAGGAIADAVTGGRQAKLTTAAIKNAPAVDDLKATASALFENSRAAKAAVNGGKFQNFAADLVQKAQAADIDPTLDGEAVAVFQRMAEMAQEAAQSGGVSLSRLHNLRQIAQDVAIDATKDRTKRFAGQIVDGLDDLIANLKPGDFASGGKQAANDLLSGISTWARAKKLAVIEEAIRLADFQKSGLENGLRIQFLRILRDPKKLKLFTPAERAELEKVGNGTFGNNILNLIGKFGFGVGNGSPNALGGAIGLTLGGLPGVVVGAAARKGSEVLTGRAANRAAQVVATPNIPVAPAMGNPLLGAKVPIELLIRGGGMAAAN